MIIEFCGLNSISSQGDLRVCIRLCIHVNISNRKKRTSFILFFCCRRSNSKPLELLRWPKNTRPSTRILTQFTSFYFFSNSLLPNFILTTIDPTVTQMIYFDELVNYLRMNNMFHSVFDSANT